jgi:hypothetical protein
MIARSLKGWTMAEVPKPSELQNVFAMSKPQHMLRKLFWEFDMLMGTLSVHHDDKQWPDAAIFIAFNTAITAWHISDWIWQSNPETRSKMASKLKVQFDEKTPTGRRIGLGRFQNNVADQCRALHICREIANGSKHMRLGKPDADVKAVAEWHEAIQGAGLAVPGDFVMSLSVIDGDAKEDAGHVFLAALGYWEELFTSEKLVEGSDRLHAKIIKAK